MKINSFIIFILFSAVICGAQTAHKISKEEYDKADDFAGRETNASYPHIFKVTTKFVADGRTTRTVVDLNENEAPLLHRIIIKDTGSNGVATEKYQLNVGFANVFCSADNKSWKASKYECYGPLMLYGPRDPEIVEYSVSDGTVDGKKVKIYREYSVFAPRQADDKKEFREEISTIDSRGFFIKITSTEGVLDPKTITLIREQSWTLNAKFEPVVAPK